MHLHTIELILFVISITLPNCETSTFASTAGEALAVAVQTTKADSNNSVWKEYITDPAGVVIYRASRPVDGPRKSRYQFYQYQPGSVLYIERVQLDDGGYYIYKDDETSSRIDLIIAGKHSCNWSAPHTVNEGTNVTYTCSFVYHGKNVKPLVWEGPGVTDANNVSIVNQSSQPISVDCYNGSATYSVTIRATGDLNNTTRTASQYGSPAKFSYRFTTGILTVKCRNGFGGSNCQRRLTCNGDNPCKNDAVCTDDSGVVTCKCMPYSSGYLCEVPIPCSTGLCQNSGICKNTTKGLFSCKCQLGYSGVVCETRLPTISTTTTAPEPLQNEGWFNYAYLLLCLLPIIGIIALILFMKKRQRKEETPSTESTELLQKQEQLSTEEEQGFIDMILSYF